MTSALEGMVTHLETTAGVAERVGANIFAIHAPQGTSPEYIVVTQTGGEPDYFSTGESGLQQSQFAIQCYSSSPLGALNLAEQVRLAISGKTGGNLGGATVRRVNIDDIRDAFNAPSGEGDESGYPAREIMATVWHSITVATP